MTTTPITAPLAADASSGSRIRAYQIAWGLALCFYFLEYASRSAPAVMIEHLVTAFGTSWQPARDSFRYVGVRLDAGF